jgi:hypothetical protein
MNKSYVKYFLIAGVVLVWGLIVVNVVKGVSYPTGEKPYVQVTHTAGEQPLDDSFLLINDYPDPFLPVLDTATEIIKAVSPLPVSNLPHISNDSITHALVKQMIQFNGVIGIVGKKKMLGMVTINGQSFVVKEGQTVNDICFNRISKRNVKIVFKKKTFTIAPN